MKERKKKMSDYVRVKAVRYKLDNKVLQDLKKEIEEKNLIDMPEELLTKKYNLQDYWEHELNKFAINSGWDFNKHEEYLFLDYLLDYEYGASGDFESVRLLTENEFKKYNELFSKYFKAIKKDELRLVHYSYYNGVDEPAVWNFEEI